jgi:hypothetical protein
MNRTEANTLVDFLRSAFPSVNDQQADLYAEMLLTEDIELASKAILAGVNEWRYPPAWAEIRERIRALHRPVREEIIEEHFDIPAWVKRWCYARFVLKPPDMRPFRESYPEHSARGNTPTLGWMPDDAYANEALEISDAMVKAHVAIATGASQDMVGMFRDDVRPA